MASDTSALLEGPTNLSLQRSTPLNSMPLGVTVKESEMRSRQEEMRSQREALGRLRQIVTPAALILAVVHVRFPCLAIDAIFLALLGIALLPWLVPLFKSLELPGGLKIEFQQLEVAAALGAAAGRRANSESPSGDLAQDAQAAAGVVARAVSTGAIARARSRRVLWVDDKPNNNVFERQALEVLGVQFILATSTEDALTRLRGQRFDAIISDMDRPPDRRAGYTLLEAVRALDQNAPFIIYSGTRAPEYRAEALRLGANGTTNRPDELFEMVISSLRSSHQSRSDA